MAAILQDNPCVVRGKYSHKEYILYTTTVKLRGDGSYREEQVYFFSTPEDINTFANAERYKPCALPEGKLIGENKIGAPFLYDKKGV